MSSSQGPRRRVRTGFYYYPVGFTITWGSREVAYVVTAHQIIDGMEAIHICDVKWVNSRDISHYDKEVSVESIDRWLRENQSPVWAETEDDFWAKLEGRDPEAERAAADEEEADLS